MFEGGIYLGCKKCLSWLGKLDKHGLLPLIPAGAVLTGVARNRRDD